MVATSGMAAALNARMQRQAARQRAAENAMQQLAQQAQFMQAMAARKQEDEAAMKEREAERAEEKAWREDERNYRRKTSEEDTKWTRERTAIQDLLTMAERQRQMKRESEIAPLEDELLKARIEAERRRNLPEYADPVEEGKKKSDALRALSEARQEVGKETAPVVEGAAQNVMGRLVQGLPGSGSMRPPAPQWEQKMRLAKELREPRPPSTDTTPQEREMRDARERWSGVLSTLEDPEKGVVMANVQVGSLIDGATVGDPDAIDELITRAKDPATPEKRRQYIEDRLAALADAGNQTAAQALDEYLAGQE